MIEVIDRIPMYPGRVKLIPVAGQANTYDLVRADEPIEPGTPINRALFQAFIDDMNAIRQQVNDKLFEMSQRVQIDSLADGSVIGLYENGVMVPFVVLEKNYVESGRVLVVRRDSVKAETLYAESDTDYSGSKTDVWLNNDYLLTLDAATQGVLVEESIPVFNEYGVYASNRKVFLLSHKEYNLASVSGLPAEGSAISYFDTAERKIALYNGTPYRHWTRTVIQNDTVAGLVLETGSVGTDNPKTGIAGIRPAFTLPSTFVVTVVVPSTENVVATAEVI